ncbi:AMP-binding protein [Actinomadura montaniterrae]|uniref:AMP-binding protein n=1 Tax=Actinomadura montaniterrae TaxID=1803903 RepID=A0A6L3WAE3_9ACTN|nr:AMP-binding protein [Actinomadura montaniterrae]KAB2390005.1 AMP-binding protein [Actinomadura montaniterrae]
MSRTLTGLFGRHARAHPGRPAVLDGGRALTYAELDAASDEVAAGLAAYGTGRGDRVALRLPRSADLVIGALGILKSGAAYSPLDVAWPPARVARITELLGAPVEVDARTLPELRARGRAAAAPARPAVREDDPAVVLFTSGSTGEPKGVLCPHRAIGRLVPRAGHLDLTAPVVMPLAAAVPWDAMSLELWSTLCSGGTLVAVRDLYLTPGRLRELVTGHGADSLVLATSVFNLHVEEDAGAFTGLRQVAVGGEQLSPRHVAAFVARHPDIALINLYGPAENGILTTTHRFTAADSAEGRVPIGVPVPGTSVHLVDGEICVSGDGLALGYLGDPAGTSERFTELTIDGRTVPAYRTGDRGHRTPDGLYHYAGRTDRQVKIRGHRIEPAEVEHAAERVPGVTRAAVVPVDGPDGRATGLALFFTGDRDGADVLADLRDRLPGYLVPARAEHVGRFPLTGNGKLDHAALVESAAGSGAARPAARPAPDLDGAGTDAERVAAVFADVLGLPTVPPDADFFSLGGDSLAAGRLSGRLAAALGAPVPLSAVFESPTPAGLTALIAGRPRTGGAPSGEDDRRDASDGAVPLLPSQLGFFVAQQMDPDDLTALCPIVWDLDGALDAAAMQQALDDVNARHEALHSRYTVLDAPVAVRPPGRPPQVELITVARPGDVLPALIAPLDIQDGRVWRAALAPGRFGIVVHHIAFDARAASVLARDLSAAYRARAEGREPRFGGPAPGLAELASGYRPPAPDDLAEQRAYWRTALSGATVVEPPPGTGPSGGLAATVRRFDEAALTAAVRSRGTTATVAALAAYAHAVADLTGRTDVVVGLPVARRGDAAAERAVACMIEMTCVRLRAPALDAAREALVEALRRPDVPVHEIARLAKLRPPYDTVVSVQDNPEPMLDVPGVRARHVWVDTDELDTALLVELLPGGRLRVSRRREAVSAGYADALADAMAGFLSGLADREPVAAANGAATGTASRGANR